MAVENTYKKCFRCGKMRPRAAFANPDKYDVCVGCDDSHTVTCATCGKEFEAVGRYSGTRKYCSDECKQQPRQRFTILTRDGFRCFYCGRSAPLDSIELHLDHVVPVMQGGDDVAGNLVTACGDCNRAKFDSLLPPELLDELLAEVRRRNEAAGILNGQRIHFAPR